MKIFLIASCLLGVIVAGCGCATKSYVRKQVEPIINKVNELDERTAENTKQLNGMDAQLQQETQGISVTAEQAGQKADDADTRAQQAQRTASTAETETASLVDAVSKLDTYHVVSQVAVQFGFDDCHLSSLAKQQLDDFGTKLSAAKNYLVVIEGRTDGAGGENYNNDLSERRANEVIRYLVAKHQLVPFKVHVVGLGKARPLASNDTPAGRKQNRRVDIKLMSNIGSTVEGPNAAQPASGDDDELGSAVPPSN